MKHHSDPYGVKADCRIHLLLCLFSGLGQGDSEYIDIEQSPAIMEGIQIQARLAESFGRAGFANRTYGKQKLLPCSVGTFVNSSVSDPNELKCVECPAGTFCIEYLKKYQVRYLPFPLPAK